MSEGRAFVVEAFITFLLVSIVMAVATDSRVPAALAAPVLGGVAAALLHANVVAPATAPTMEAGDPQADRSAGDRSLATGSNNPP